MKKYLLSGVALTFAAALGATAALADITVATVGPISGQLAALGEQYSQGAKKAVDDINKAGGVMGHKIVPVVEDGASDWPTFAEKAKKLLQRDKVAAVVGCYTSASRKAVLPVFKANKGLLYYPTYYEGQEEDPQVIYTSQEATQSVIASMEWMAKQGGKTFFLVGSDYIYPRTCNNIAKATAKRLGVKIVGEEYAPLGHTEFSSIINKVKAAKPDWIYSTVVGGSNVAFYKQLKAAGLDGAKQNLLSTVVSENEIDGIGKDNAVGYYACMGYFQSIKSPENEKFVAAIKAKYGQDRVVGDPMECGYNSVYLWKLAAEKAKSFDVAKVIAASSNIEFAAPEGLVRIHAKNHHVWKKVRVGRARADGQFDIVHESGLTEPNPFPKL